MDVLKERVAEMPGVERLPLEPTDGGAGKA